MKMRAVVFGSGIELVQGKENGFEWFSDPSRQIMLLHLGSLPDGQRFPPFDIDSARPFFASVNEQLEQAQLTPDQVLFIGNSFESPGWLWAVSHKFRKQIIPISTVDCDRIIRILYYIEHQP